MSNDWLIITEKAKEKLRIGELVDTRTFDPNRSLITDKWLKLYALALRDSNPLWFDDAYAKREGRFGRRVVPTAYYTLFNPMENGGACPASDFWAELHGKPGRYWGGHAAYNKIDAKRPLRLGDRVGYCELRNRDCFEKRGKKNVLVCVETEYRVFTAEKELVAVCAYGNMSQFGYPPGTEPKA
jgi:acyl dehydratase